MVRRAAILAATLGLAGCQLVLGIEERVLVDAADAGAGGAGGAGGARPDAGVGGAGGSGGAAPCTAGHGEACYDGPDGTAGVGRCKPGQRTCAPDGSGYGACEGAVLPQIDDCATDDDENCDGASPACTGDVVAAKDEGGAGDDAALAVATLASGDPIVVGVEPGAPRGGALVGAAFAQRRDATTLSIRWMQGFSQGGSSLASVGAGALGDLVVAGAVSGATTYGGTPIAAKGGLDALVMKLDADTGAPVWARSWGDAGFDQVASGVAVDRAGNAFVVGHFEGSLPLDASHVLASKARSAFVAKLDRGGAVAWAVALPGTFSARADAVAVDPAGDPVVVGTFAGAISLGSRVLATTGLADTDAFVAWLDAGTGAPRRALRLGDASAQAATSVAITQEGGVVVGGSTDGAIRVGDGGIDAAGDGGRHGFVLALSPAGALAWGARVGDTGAEIVRAVAVDPLGAVLAVGEAAGAVKLGALDVETAAGDPGSVLVAKLGPAGEPRWLRLFGDVSLQRGLGVAASPTDARVSVVGAFAGALSPAAITSSGGDDAFVLSLSP